MRIHEARDSAETFSPAEARFNRRRRTVGLVVGPALFLVVLLWPLPAVSMAAHHVAAILCLVIVFWITEALPLAVTAVLGPVLAIVLRVAPARTVFAPFADPVIFLFIGSFILAEAMFVHGVDRRIAFRALSARAVGSTPIRILVVYGAVTTGLSMWMSNTATTAMMFPIGLSIVACLMRTTRVPDPTLGRFAMAMMLMTAFGASVGGIATPVGTPPNLIGIGMLEQFTGTHISFFQWMALGLPTMFLLFAWLVVYFYLVGARGVRVAGESTAMVSHELTQLGPLSIGERNVLIAFGLTVTLWITPGVLALFGTESAFVRVYAAAMPESAAAMVGAILLFVLPVNWRARRFTLTWDEAARIDWGTILLFGGGMAMGELAYATGLAELMGKGIAFWLPSQTPFAITALFTAFAIVLSETASNTASATMIVPIAIAVADAAGIRAIEPAIGATLGASMGFMMPISTPPNAIVYSSGFVPITSMMRHGVTFDIVGFVVVVGMVTMLGPVLF